MTSSNASAPSANDLPRRHERPHLLGRPWPALIGFVRLCTNPLGVDQACEVVDFWLRHSVIPPLEPTGRHLHVVRSLLRPLGTAANLTNDAHLAAIALEHGARICSFDNDFDRFPGLERHQP